MARRWLTVTLDVEVVDLDEEGKFEKEAGDRGIEELTPTELGELVRAAVEHPDYSRQQGADPFVIFENVRVRDTQWQGPGADAAISRDEEPGSRR